MTTSSGSYDRSALLHCQHYVARCGDCGLAHHIWELATDRLCARCHGDLTSELRRHVSECPDVASRRAAAVPPAPKERLRASARAANNSTAGAVIHHRNELPAGSRGCPLCSRMVEPGEPVSFRLGQVSHLRCYEASRQPASRGPLRGGEDS